MDGAHAPPGLSGRYRGRERGAVGSRPSKSTSSIRRTRDKSSRGSEDRRRRPSWDCGYRRVAQQWSREHGNSTWRLRVRRRADLPALGTLLGQGGGPRSRRAVGVGDVAGERGDRAARIRRGNRGDWDAAFRDTAPDFEVTFKAGPEAGTHRGREAWSRSSAIVFSGFDFWIMEPVEFLESIDQVVVVVDHRLRPKGGRVVSSSFAMGTYGRFVTERALDGRVRDLRGSPRSRRAVGVGASLRPHPPLERRGLPSVAAERCSPLPTPPSVSSTGGVGGQERPQIVPDWALSEGCPVAEGGNRPLDPRLSPLRSSRRNSRRAARKRLRSVIALAHQSPAARRGDVA